MKAIELGKRLAENKAITVNLRFTGKGGNARKFAEEMTAGGTVAAIRAEAGNLRYEYYQSLDDPETILLIDSCVPSQDARFGIRFERTSSNGIADFHADSRWSEQHAAYACGLGTFGLSRGLISEKGIAGRYASILVSERWQATERGCTGIDDYCIKCGVCAKNCPAQAISLENGKNNILCNAHVEKMKA